MFIFQQDLTDQDPELQSTADGVKNKGKEKQEKKKEKETSTALEKAFNFAD